jgi:transcriptional regulator with PAS, ATPase and Fis domain
MDEFEKPSGIQSFRKPEIKDEFDPIHSDLTTDLKIKEIGRQAVGKAEKEIISETLKRTCWNRRKAAALLQISYKALLYKIKKYELEGE